MAGPSSATELGYALSSVDLLGSDASLDASCALNSSLDALTVGITTDLYYQTFDCPN